MRLGKFKVNSRVALSDIAFENDTAIGTRSASASLITPTRTHEDFNFDAIDDLKDDIRQRMRDGESFDEIIKSLAYAEAEMLVLDRIAVFIALIRSAKKPILFLDCLWMLSGAALREGATIQSLAKKHGCSKQAFQQAMERVGEKFKFPKTRTERDDEAKEAMREAYYHMPKL